MEHLLFQHLLWSPRLLVFSIFFSASLLWLILKKGEREYSQDYGSVDAIVPAYNEEVTIARTLGDLMQNKYIRRIIVIDDGSKDQTAEIVSRLQYEYPDKIFLLRQENTGKAGAINAGLEYVESDKVFLTDADIRIPNDNGLGYLIKAIEKGADAVAGIPGSDLNQISFWGKVRASIKIFFATFRKCGGEIIGGYPFCISGSVGMYKTEVLRKVKMNGRTCVEDLDLTWELISRGYKITQSSQAIVFSQEAATLADDLKRWRRWISGYAVCMRLHKGLLLSRFGLTIIITNCIIGLFGIIWMIIPFLLDFRDALWGIIVWFGILFFASGYSAFKQGKKWWLVFYSPFSVLILVYVFICWILWGLPSLATGEQYAWEKVTRY